MHDGCDTASRPCGSGGAFNFRPERGSVALCERKKWQWASLMATGTVKWFNATKGYGFITPDEGGKDIFVHITAVETAGMGTLAEGQRVRFEVIPDKRGQKAVNLARAD
jgi:CspA family cold shock protein